MVTFCGKTLKQTFVQGCIISPKDRSGGGGDIMGTFEKPKGGPLDMGKNIGTLGRIYISASQRLAAVLGVTHAQM